VEVFARFEVGPLACNCYIVGDPQTRMAVVVDPGGDAQSLLDALTSRGITVVAIVATHAHFDHLVAADALRRATGAPFLMHDADRFLLDWYEESARLFLGVELGPPPEVDSPAGEGDVLTAGAAELTVVHTPGHSPGSITLATEGVIFSGDTLFQGSIGRSDLPGGDGRALVGTIREKLLGLGDEVVVYPGHGPATTIGAERRSNPFVGETAGFWLPPS
jgi:hydroxyacylglutathione hydrolase